MATRLERWSYRKFKAALDEQYNAALDNLEQDGEASVNWIRKEPIADSYYEVWPVVSLYSGSRMLKSIIGVSDIADDPWARGVRKYMDTHLAEHITEVWSTSKSEYLKAVRTATETATNEGLGIEATQRRIRKLVNGKLKGDINIWRARRIALTEVKAASELGNLYGMQEAERQGAMIGKQWFVRYGAKHPRHADCPHLDGQIRALGKPFDVCGEPLMYPGDPMGSAGNVINCYCIMQPVAMTKML